METVQLVTSSPPLRRSTRSSHSDRLSERKKNLFGTPREPKNSSDDDDDLGPIALLRHSPELEHLDQEDFTFLKQSSAGSKTVLNSNDKENIPIQQQKHNQKPSKNMSPLILSPNTAANLTSSARKLSPSTLTASSSPSINTNVLISTPTSGTRSTDGGTSISPVVDGLLLKISPTQALKTPHDESSCVNSTGKLPRQPRKSLSDSTNHHHNHHQNLKRKSLSPGNSPDAKQSKVRTALFPADSFYPKTDESTNKREKHHFVDQNTMHSSAKPKSKSSSTMYLCSRKSRSRNRYGQINAGVRHKIRKPKQKKLSRTQLLKAAMKIIEESPLNQFLENNSTVAGTSTIGTPFKANKSTISKEQIAKMDAVLSAVSVNVPFANESVPLELNITDDAFVRKQPDDGAKRKRSPSPNLTKKFFKHSHSRKATFTVNERMKVEMDGSGKMTLLESQRKKRRLLFSAKAFETACEEIRVEESEINNVLSLLDADVEEDAKSAVPAAEANSSANGNIVLTASTTVSGSENSIQIHEPPSVLESQGPSSSSIVPASETLTVSGLTSTTTLTDPSILLSPTSQMCDMTSGLALSSPNKSQAVKNLTENLDMCSNNRKPFSYVSASPSSVSSSSSSSNATLGMNKENKGGGENQNKLFPIFYGGAGASAEKPREKPKEITKLVSKYYKTLPKDQMLLDFGQKNLDMKKCMECGTVYNMGNPDDENMHLKIHHSVDILRFNGWKNERVVAYDASTKDRIIVVYPTDSKVWWKKIYELMNLVHEDLGYSETCFKPDVPVKVFLYIKQKQIAGCLVAEPKTLANKLLPLSDEIDACSTETYPVKCGVSRLWVAVNCRRQGVATGLMNTLRKNFMFDGVLRLQDIALSPTTGEGKTFAAKYFNTPNYYVYTDL